MEIVTKKWSKIEVLRKIKLLSDDIVIAEGVDDSVLVDLLTSEKFLWEKRLEDLS